MPDYEVLSRPWKSLPELSTRAKNLRCWEYRLHPFRKIRVEPNLTVRDVCAMIEIDIYKCIGCGMKTVKEVKRVLASYGLELNTHYQFEDWYWGA